MYIPKYRNEQVQMIINIFNNKGYTITKAKVSKQYNTSNKRIRFIIGYRKGYIMN